MRSVYVKATTAQASNQGKPNVRDEWAMEQARDLYEQSFPDLLFRAQTIHRQHFDPTEVQLSTLISIKSGACPEDCGYCPQSARFKTGLEAEPLMDEQVVLEAAARASANGASRFCMGAAWRNPRPKDLLKVARMIEGVKALGLETCATLGMLEPEQAAELKKAGLDYYNHNIDTSESYYPEIIGTRTFQERIDTLQTVRDAGISVCCGGIVGMGEAIEDRLQMLVTLANLNPPPESVPINQLVPVQGTPLEDAAEVDPFEFVRIIALARIMMPLSRVKLSAGRQSMDDATQALCFLAGANSIFYGEMLLTTDNADIKSDQKLFQRLGLKAAHIQAG